MNDRCPRSLFKYFGHSLWPEERLLENPAFKLFETLTLKVNPPSEFNDPFEFSPVFDDRSRIVFLPDLRQCSSEPTS